MKIDGVAYRSVWVDRADGWSVHIIDQTKLPWALEILRLTDVAQAAHAIRAMQARGAPLIGALAAYGLCLALRADAPPRRWSAMPPCWPPPARRRSTCAGRWTAC